MQYLESFSDLLAEINQSNQFVVLDKSVVELYKIPERDNMLLIEGGETCKTFSSFEYLVEQLLAKGIQRDSRILAVGGGTVSDLVGFVAATILRGVSWRVCPTTLLGMVDAAIGGKTAINSGYGKNLIGAFHSPQNILFYYPFIETLSRAELHSGIGEIVKYAFIDHVIYDMLVADGVTENLVECCMKFKQDIVKRDPLEKGERIILNLGHTWGHAIEKENGLAHGIAVIVGLQKLFLMENDRTNLKRLRNILSKVEIDVPSVQLTTKHLHYVVHDKKNKDDGITFVLTDGKTVVYSQEQLRQWIKNENI